MSELGASFSFVGGADYGWPVVSLADALLSTLSYTMSFEDDCLDNEPLIRPSVCIRILGSDGELLDVIEIPEITIERPFTDPALESEAVDQQHTTVRGERF